MRKKLVLFSEDDHRAMVSLVKDSIKEIEKILETNNVTYGTFIVNHKLTEVLWILTEEGE